MVYRKDRTRVREMMLKSGVVVVMNKKHITKPEDLATTMWEVYQAGYVAETTFRIDPDVLKEGMKECVKMREEAPVPPERTAEPPAPAPEPESGADDLPF